MWLCNPKGFLVFIPLQPENILIELPILPICISLTSAPGLGFLPCPFPAGASASLPASCLSQALPCDAGILWLTGTMWPLRSIHPTPLSPLPGQPDAGWRAREIFLRLHQGVRGSRPSRGYRELLHRWGFPSCSQLPAFSIPAPRAPPAFPMGARPGPNPEEPLSLRVCALMGDVCCAVLGAHRAVSPPLGPLLVELLGVTLFPMGWA